MKRKLRILLRYLAALLVALSILAPMTWLFLMSVSATADLTRVPLEWLPRQWDFSRYARLLSLQPGEPGALFLPALRNSLLVAAGATLVSLLLAVPAAFSFSRYPGRDGWLYAGLGIYMVPPVAFVLPLYFILEHFGLLNTRSGLVLVYCSLIMPFLTWMVKNQFDALPQDIEQAARLDGLRVWQVLLRITLPLAKPMLGASALFGWLPATLPPRRCRSPLPDSPPGAPPTMDWWRRSVSSPRSRRCLSPSGYKKRWSAVSLTVEVKDNYANAHRACALYRR